MSSKEDIIFIKFKNILAKKFVIKYNTFYKTIYFKLLKTQLIF